MNPQELLSHFSILKDYRQDWKVKHSLSDILLLTVCGLIAGAEGEKKLQFLVKSILTCWSASAILKMEHPSQT
ncbi:hypothetical protein DN062_02610 [Nitrincola tibetensis]|uniref:H repeat-associated protein N-terminal domain-containing protein n=1 Tax=Nitrincola tibetensis TaxID=2219697 RepID=A0A364NPZ7_9GAMM|nr:hypothetical protein DN062_02610 [Nitrincola tibetensis]